MSPSLEKQNKTNKSLRYECKPTLVKQHRKFLQYNRGDEATEMFTDVYATGYYWNLSKSLDNTDSTISGTQKTTVEVGRTTKSGSEWEVHFEMEAAYGGLTASFGGSYKSFSEQEMATKTRTEMTFNIEKGSAFYLYQKVYTFTTNTWFMNDAWNMNRIVYTEGGRKKLELKGKFESTTLEQKITSSPLDETPVSITIKGTEEEVIKQDDSCVGYNYAGPRCRDKLKDLGDKLYG